MFRMSSEQDFDALRCSVSVNPNPQFLKVPERLSHRRKNTVCMRKVCIRMTASNFAIIHTMLSFSYLFREVLHVWTLQRDLLSPRQHFGGHCSPALLCEQLCRLAVPEHCLQRLPGHWTPSPVTKEPICLRKQASLLESSPLLSQNRLKTLPWAPNSAGCRILEFDVCGMTLFIGLE